MRNKVRIGLIGAGGIAEFSHLPAFSALDNVELVSVCDIVEERAKKTVQQWHAKEYYTDYRKMLTTSEIDAVDICTPVYLHEQMTIECAQAGKHLLVEKPLARNLKEAERMAEACKRANVKLSAIFNMRYIPINVEIKRILREGSLGKIHMIRIRMGHPGPEITMPYMASWIFNKEKSGGGCVIDEIHAVDLLCWWLGEVDHVSAELGILSKKIEVEDNAAITLGFKNGVIGVMEISWSQIPGSNAVEIYGENGTLIADPFQNSLRIYKKEPPSWFEPVLASKEYWHWHRFQIKEFAEAILSNKEVPITVEEALSRQRIIDCIYASNSHGKKVNV